MFKLESENMSAEIVFFKKEGLIKSLGMKIIAGVIGVFIVFFVSSGNVLVAQDNNDQKSDKVILKLMTYNLKFASPAFEPTWDVRREMQIDMIRKYDPDIIGTQEGLKEQIDYLADHLKEYVVVGEGRKGGDDDEHMAIFFKRDKFRLRELQSFQLSKTPEIIGSGPEVNPRMVTWIRLALKNISPEGNNGRYPEDYRGHWENTREFYVFNTHYFNGRRDSLARLNASKLIMQRINALNRFGAWTRERPVFLMGDFNCRPGSAPYNILVGDKDPTDPDLLKNSFEDPKKIDWILYKGSVNVLKYEDVDYNVHGVYPSDHKPIYVEFEIIR
jgi:endonuclease/exonuclease/phosphatase family metal-dependent hydrolase